MFHSLVNEKRTQRMFKPAQLCLEMGNEYDGGDFERQRKQSGSVYIYVYTVWLIYTYISLKNTQHIVKTLKIALKQRKNMKNHVKNRKLYIF